MIRWLGGQSARSAADLVIEFVHLRVYGSACDGELVGRGVSLPGDPTSIPRALHPAQIFWPAAQTHLTSALHHADYTRLLSLPMPPADHARVHPCTPQLCFT